MLLVGALASPTVSYQARLSDLCSWPTRPARQPCATERCLAEGRGDRLDELSRIVMRPLASPSSLPPPVRTALVSSSLTAFLVPLATYWAPFVSLLSASLPRRTTVDSLGRRGSCDRRTPRDPRTAGLCDVGAICTPIYVERLPIKTGRTDDSPCLAVARPRLAAGARALEEVGGSSAMSQREFNRPRQKAGPSDGAAGTVRCD
jgi:hypothetical protein